MERKILFKSSGPFGCCLLLDIGLIEFVNILLFWPSQCRARPAVQRSATIIIFIEMRPAPRPVSATGLGRMITILLCWHSPLLMVSWWTSNFDFRMNAKIARLAIADGENEKEKIPKEMWNVFLCLLSASAQQAGTLDVGWFTPVD